jgi:hypothetical protein
MAAHLPESDRLGEKASLRREQLKQACIGDALMVGVAGLGVQTSGMGGGLVWRREKYGLCGSEGFAADTQGEWISGGVSFGLWRMGDERCLWMRRKWM